MSSWISYVVSLLLAIVGAPSPHPVGHRDPKPNPLVSTAPPPAAFTFNPPSNQPGVLKVMAVGDSITQGKTGDHPWRCQLYIKASVVLRLDMVGVRNDLNGGGDYADARCDTDHDAQWGRLLSDAKTTIAADVTTSHADVILVLLGVNDVAQNHLESTIEADFTELVANARGANPNLRIVAGTVLPTDGIVSQAGIDEYNDWLLANAAGLGVVLVDTAAVIDPVLDLYDGVHPTAEGSEKIAKVFLPAILRR